MALAAIKGQIESLSRALVSAINKPKSAEEERDAKRDLAAQEGMAKWAKWMFWAARAEAFLTFVGIPLVWRTLVYTKRAAEAAKAAVRGAEKATAAAIEGNSISRENSRTELRAYVHALSAQINRDEAKQLQIKVVIKNVGQTSAVEASMWVWMDAEP